VEGNMTDGRRTSAAILVMLAALALVLPYATPASAGGDPYGSTTTTAAPGENPSCTLSAESAAPGTKVDATVAGVFVGSTVKILIGSQEVGSGVATTPDGGDGTAKVTITFTVPAVTAGSYPITASSGTFTQQCGTTGRFEVLAATVAKPPSGPLARTGVQVGLLVAVGLALLVGGRAVLSASRARRRRARRAPGRHSARV
jgi:hypothetical protein